MSAERTTIQIRPETREKLFKEKNGPTDTYDDVLNRLLSDE